MTNEWLLLSKVCFFLSFDIFLCRVTLLLYTHTKMRSIRNIYPKPIHRILCVKYHFGWLPHPWISIIAMAIRWVGYDWVFLWRDKEVKRGVVRNDFVICFTAYIETFIQSFVKRKIIETLWQWILWIEIYWKMPFNLKIE